MGQNPTGMDLIKNHKASGNTGPQSVCHQSYKDHFTVISPLPPPSASVLCYSGNVALGSDFSR